MKSKHVLFLCPHAAAKSVIAMTYFQDLAKQAGLQTIASNAGTEPDPTINPKVEQLLQSEGYDLTGFHPTLLTSNHFNDADLVVSIGCLSKEEVPQGTQYLDWSDVPMLSEDFQGSRNRILAHVQSLVAQLEN